MEVDPKVPRVIHAIRVSLRSPAVRAIPELAGGTVLATDITKGRGTISKIVADRTAIGGINADFFPPSGDPLGLMVRDRVLLSEPWKVRHAFAWGAASAAIGASTFTGSFSLADGTSFAIDGVNREVANHELVLLTADAALALTKQASVSAILTLPESQTVRLGESQGMVDLLVSDSPSTEIRPGTFMLTATGNRMPAVTRLRKGDAVKVSLRIDGFDWTKLYHAVGGGPRLVVKGKAANNWKAEGFQEVFSSRRHPRTAIGVTAKGEVWMVAVDGRQPMSDGATLDEMAAIMLRYRCVDALNLDGGGSTTLHLLGSTLNRPSDGRERPVANAVVLQGQLAPVILRPLRLEVLEDLGRVVDEAGLPVPNSDVLWSAVGDAWVDQGGRLRWLKPGNATLTARVEGQLLSVQVTKVPPSPPPVLDPGRSLE